jgi:hypothetical protein
VIGIHQIAESFLLTTDATDWLGITLGAFYVAMALVVAMLTARFFHRRSGPAAAFTYAILFWGAVAGVILVATRGHPSKPSMIAAAVAALVTVGYAGYLAACRKDLRIRPGDVPPPAPAQRQCPGCGLTIGAELPKCPACGANQAESK